jgi:hypothetical protein
MNREHNNRFQSAVKTCAFLCHSLRSNKTQKRSGFGAAEAGVRRKIHLNVRKKTLVSKSITSFDLLPYFT